MYEMKQEYKKKKKRTDRQGDRKSCTLISSICWLILAGLTLTGCKFPNSSFRFSSRANRSSILFCNSSSCAKVIPIFIPRSSVCSCSSSYRSTQTATFSSTEVDPSPGPLNFTRSLPVSSKLPIKTLSAVIPSWIDCKKQKIRILHLLSVEGCLIRVHLQIGLITKIVYLRSEIGLLRSTENKCKKNSSGPASNFEFQLHLCLQLKPFNHRKKNINVN